MAALSARTRLSAKVIQATLKGGKYNPPSQFSFLTTQSKQQKKKKSLLEKRIHCK